MPNISNLFFQACVGCSPFLKHTQSLPGNVCPHVEILDNYQLVASGFAWLSCLYTTLSTCADRSAALSRAQKEMLDSLSLFKPVQSRKRSPSWFLPLKQLLNFHYYIRLGSMLGFWIASIFLLPRNYHSSHHLPTVSLLCFLISQSIFY